jgi:DNA modification methylase
MGKAKAIKTEKKEFKNSLYYGDNLEVLRKYIKDESIDLCYIDPPFNSKRNYNQIYNNIGTEDAAQAQAFIDTWTWDEAAEKGLDLIVNDDRGVFTSQSVDLIVGLKSVLGKGSLLSYVISMTLRIGEIYRVLKPSGSFYLHCDPNASHYLKLVLDAIFCSRKGEYLNEIIWKRAETVKGNFGQGTKRLDTNTDTIFLYAKTTDENKFYQVFKEYSEEYINQFFKYYEPDGRRYRLTSMIGPGGSAKGNPEYEVMGVTRFWRYSKEKMAELIKDGLVVQTNPGTVPSKKQYLDEGKGIAVQSLWDDVPALHATDSERLGYPTQKPEALLERIIKVSSDEGDVVLDAYCGCGTTVAVSQHLKRKWIGIDITYQSISLILKRLEDTHGKKILNTIELNGVPKDIKSAVALAEKKEDKTRKEFEKWVILTFSNNRAKINEKKGGDGGIDGIAYILDEDKKGKQENKKVLFSVKSDKSLTPSVIRDLAGTLDREEAVMGYLLTLYDHPNIVKESKKYGQYKSKLFGNEFPKIQVISAEQILAGERLTILTRDDVVKKAKSKNKKTSQEKLF